MAALVLVLVASTLGPSAVAAAPDGSRVPGPETSQRRAADWHRYVLGPRRADVRPVDVETTGDVTSPEALLDEDPQTEAVLTTGIVQESASVLLDFGKNMSGTPYVEVVSSSGLPVLSMVTTEAEEFIRDDMGMPSADDDGSLSGAGGETNVLASSPGRLNLAFRGGFRFVLLTLRSPGTLVLGGAGTRFEAFRATPEDYEGWFLSSDDELNRIWYAGAYTNQLNMAPAGLQGSSVDKVLDGAKRDRSIWTGDLIVQIPVLAASLGEVGNAYSRSSLEVLLAQQRDDGALPGSPDFSAGTSTGGYAFFYSVNYSGYGVRSVIEYVRRTGDLAFARTHLEALRRGIAYNETFVDDEGLVVSDDPDYWQTDQTGQVTKYSLDYYVLLREMAWLERALGNRSEARELGERARTLARAVEAELWNKELGAYPQSDQNPDVLVADANALALQHGIHPPGARASIKKALRSLWLPKGSRIGEGLADPGGHPIEPFGIAIETGARFDVGDGRGALDLLRRTWGQMVDPQGPWYTGALWEFLGPDGQVLAARDSLAHGWAAGPTQQLTERVLGIRPVAAGYRTWSIAPVPGGVTWARGQVPTPREDLRASWRRTGSAFELELSAPRGTRGTVTVPARRGQQVLVDGRTVWSGRPLVPGVRVAGRGIRVPVGAGTHVVQVRNG